jgi:peptidoglycan hydrolase-like protein with peptidoglycan-binding domain
MTPPLWFKRELDIGDTGPDVRIVRRKLGLPDDGPYDRVVAERVRGMAKHRNLDSDGEVNAAMAEALGESAVNEAGLTPEWYTRDLQLWFQGEDVAALRGILGVPAVADDRYDPDLEAAVRRFQSAHDLPVDGLVTADLAILIGEA